VTEFKRRRGKPLRFIRLPLHDDHPDWLELDRQLPPDHLARRIRFLVESLDLSPLLETYSGVGGRLTPPELLLAFVLFENQRKRLSPAEWFLDSQESGPARWLLRGLRPCRATFYRFAGHLSGAMLDSLNQQVLLLAVAEGHTAAEHGSLDGTFTAGYGSRHRLLNDEALTARRQQLDQAIAGDNPAAGPGDAEACPAKQTPPGDVRPSLDGPGPASASLTLSAEPAPSKEETVQPAEPLAVKVWPYWMAGSPAGRLRQRTRHQAAQKTLKQRMLEHDQRQKGKAKSRRTSAAKLVICPTEPEAVLGRDKHKVFRPLYNLQIMQDADGPFILGYGVFSQANDSGLLPSMVRRTQELTGRKMKKVLADGIYASLKDVRYCKETGVELFAPVLQGGGAKNRSGKGNGKEKQIGKEQFHWEEELQTYRCPEGHLLQGTATKQRERGNDEYVQMQEYRCAKEHCMKCPQASRCTSRPDKGRTVTRMVGQEMLDEVAARMKTKEGKEEYKKRGQTVEPRHADMRTHRGLQRFRGYGRRRADSQVALLTLVHNGLSLLKARKQNKASLSAAVGPPLPSPPPSPDFKSNDDWLCWN
jgi:hypothetical protein